MPRPSYFRSLTSGPERGAPHLRPARPPLWGPSRAPDYDAPDHSIVPKPNAEPDSNREDSRVSLPAESSRRERMERGSSISIRGFAQPSSKAEFVTEFSTLPATEPPLVERQQRAAKLEGRDQPSPATLEDTTSMSAETGRDKILPQKYPETQSSNFTKRSRERAPFLDHEAVAIRLQPVVQFHANRSLTDSRLLQGTASQNCEASSWPDVGAGDAQPDRPAAEHQGNSPEAFGVRLEVRKESKFEGPRDREDSLGREPNDRLPLIERAVEPARKSDSPREGNKVHIGTVDIQIIPPATPPNQPAARQPPSVNRTMISRGFTSSYGLRQA